MVLRRVVFIVVFFLVKMVKVCLKKLTSRAAYV